MHIEPLHADPDECRQTVVIAVRMSKVIFSVALPNDDQLGTVPHDELAIKFA